jgi:hypothetical protein
MKSRRLRWVGHVASVGERRGAYRVLVGKRDGKRPLEKPRRRWEVNIKMDFREVGCEGIDWIDMAPDRQVAGCCECSNEGSDFIKCGEFCE